MKVRKSEFLDLVADAFCDVFGDSTNAILRRTCEGYDHEYCRDTACLLGARFGIWNGEKIPPRYKCIDFLKAFSLTEEDLKCVPNENALYHREKNFIPLTEKLIGAMGMNALNRIICRLVKDPERILELLEDHFRDYPKITRLKLGYVSEFCYEDPKIAEIVYDVCTGGIIPRIAALAKAKIEGYEDVELVNKELDGNCVRFIFEPKK